MFWWKISTLSLGSMNKSVKKPWWSRYWKWKNSLKWTSFKRLYSIMWYKKLLTACKCKLINISNSEFWQTLLNGDKAKSIHGFITNQDVWIDNYGNSPLEGNLSSCLRPDTRLGSHRQTNEETWPLHKAYIIYLTKNTQRLGSKM
jgi:hypothetical protein